MRKSKSIFVKDLFVFFHFFFSAKLDQHSFMMEVILKKCLHFISFYEVDTIYQIELFFITFHSLVYFCSLLGYVFAQLKIYSINENKTVNLHIIKYVNYWVEKIRNNKLPEQILPRVFNSLLFNYMWIIHVKHDLSRFY